MITSPYYFAPFAKNNPDEPEVFLPEDANLVSHDHPFMDGLSGHLEIELEATTPIYIRSAGDHREYRDSEGLKKDIEHLLKTYPTGRNIGKGFFSKKREFAEYAAFYHIDSTPAIPGTSLKGAVRTVLQVLTKGRCEPVNDRRYSMRDLDSPDYKSWFKGRVRSGFVKWDQKNAQHVLLPCRHAKAKQEFLEEKVKAKNSSINLGEPQDAEDKYVTWLKHMPYEMEFFIKGDEASFEYSENSEKQRGIIVFVGQVADRALHKNAKNREYVFFDYQESPRIPISEDVWQGFLDSHEDTNRVPTKAWKYWKDQLERNPQLMMPVFYLAHQRGQDGSLGNSRCLLKHPDAVLHSFGLSMLYRLPYRLSLHGAIPESHRPPVEPDEDQDFAGFDGYGKDFKPDFPSLLFGEARPRRHLKGRVSFGHLKRTVNKGSDPLVITVLGGPKPGFYPNYMERGRTLMQEDARLRGWKFYAARPDKDYAPEIPDLPIGREVSSKVCTAFEPLSKGTKFRGKVRFHNLRPHELGALLWALTWGGRAECRHRLGMAKPLGYGCARIGIQRAFVVPNQIVDAEKPNAESLLDPSAIKNYVETFEQWLCLQPHMANWLEGETVRTMLSIVRHDHGVAPRQLKYPVLKPDQKINHFKDAKQSGQTLPEWLSIANHQAGFTFWPDEMLPQQQPELDPNVLPGRHLGDSARRDTSEMAEGQNYLCLVISKKQAARKIRLQVVGGDATTEGALHLLGEHSRFFDLLEEQQEIVVHFKSGGSKNRDYYPVPQ